MNFNIVSLLINSGANVNLIDDNGESPLIIGNSKNCLKKYLLYLTIISMLFWHEGLCNRFN